MMRLHRRSGAVEHPPLQYSFFPVLCFWQDFVVLESVFAQVFALESLLTVKFSGDFCYAHL
jgi:hypothetical protein